MDPIEFCRWLQGYAELGGEAPNEKQWEIIKEHLQLVFVKVTDEQRPYLPETTPSPIAARSPNTSEAKSFKQLLEEKIEQRRDGNWPPHDPYKRVFGVESPVVCGETHFIC